MRMKLNLILFVFYLVFQECQGGKYFISAPRNVVPGTAYDISVDILKQDIDNVTVEAILQDYSFSIPEGPKSLLTANGTFSPGVRGTLSMPIDFNLHCSYCRILLKGYNPLQFEQDIFIQISSDILSILIQTDKAIYKPKERVNFRILAAYYNLQLYTGTFHYEILDPYDNKINVLSGVSGTFGVVEGFFDLSDQPSFGTWKINVRTETVSGAESQFFEVAEYDLPRFQVDVGLPPFALLSDTTLSGSVEAKYTFGQPVYGLVLLQIGENVDTIDKCNVNRKVTEISFEIKGKGNFSVPLEDIRRSVHLNEKKKIKITAFVTEASTGIKLNGSSVITYYGNRYQIKFLEMTPAVFKPGLQYTAYVQVTTPDGLPPTDSNLSLSVYTSVTYQMTVPDQELYSPSSFSGSYPLPGQNMSLPANGILSIDIDIPLNATSIDIKVSLNKETTAEKRISKSYSMSNNYLQLSLLSKLVKAESDVLIKITSTEAIDSLAYEIRSRSDHVKSGVLELSGQREFNATFKVEPSWAPIAQLLMYYIRRDSNEVVTDSLAFNVEGMFKNKVNVAFKENETDINKNVSLELSADSDSQIYVLAVDQSVLLLKTGNDLTPNKVKDSFISKFHKGAIPTDSNFALSYSGSSINEVFSNMGLVIATDLNIFAPFRPIALGRFPSSGFDRQGMMGAPMAMSFRDDNAMESASFEMDVATSTKPVERVRSFFPESWLWTSVKSINGHATLTTTVPDTITSWIVSAFATNSDTGLGVAPTTSKLRVFRPFFVSLTYPRSVTRNEQFIVQATVFNYLPVDLMVTVSLKENPFLTPITPGPGNQASNIQVRANEQGIVYFSLSAPTVGSLDIEVSARSNMAADAIVRQILIKHEGAPVVYNNPILINLSNNQSTFEKNIAFTLPDSLVPESQRIRVKVTGDLIGSTVQSLTSLLTLPTGCGEQSLVKFTPNIHIGRYLKATNQLSEELNKKIIDLLNDGYQRQLTYKRYDNGFSAFGNYDISSSTWLTALVVTSFAEAQEFIFVDKEIILKASMLLIDRQNIDGSFNEFGKVLDRNTQGTTAGPALTAFVLVALLKAKELADVQDCKNNNKCRYYLLGNATLNATRNLERLMLADSIDDQFSLAVASYAFAEAKSQLAQSTFEKLLTFVKQEGGLEYWSANSTVNNEELNRFINWRPPRLQARPIDILITSYAILTYSSLGRLDEALPSVRWLTLQKNAQGGFVSTQDTVVGLQALSSYGSKSFRPDTNITIYVSDMNTHLTMNVNSENALSLQIQEIQSNSQDFSITASGSGLALLDIEYSFNVLKELSKPVFDVNTVLLDDKLDSFNIMVCTKFLMKHDTGMVVQELSIPSGFVPDLSTLGQVAGVKRSERKGSIVAIYFDKISGSSLCYSIVMTREAKVAKSQKSYVRTYDYYEPANQATVFYQPRTLRDSTVCDVCLNCCP
uniref:Thioester-containing protein 1.4 n=1 Tax=Biomphalaria glabrata TaxID=6526 RepID=D7R6D6_BIOGL|nr:thioester-containing protein 1.4 [Biomphalaria glabrata]